MEVWGTPNYKDLTRAVIRTEISETEEFGLINDYNAARAGLLEEDEAKKTEDYLSHLLPSIGGALADFYDTLTPWLLFGLVLIITDLRFGIKKAVKRGEEIRGSTAWRRTINKMADYFCWVTLAGLCGRSVGVVLGIPIVSKALFLIIYGIEISSCLNNYFEYKGIKKRFNFFKLIGKKEIDDALEDIPEEAQEAELEE